MGFEPRTYTLLWQVLVHWACAKINASSDIPDDRVRDELTAKLAGCPGIRYASIASHAQAIGRRTLAALLLDYETCAAEQVGPGSHRGLGLEQTLIVMLFQVML
jgi:hypothetical protein